MLSYPPQPIVFTDYNTGDQYLDIVFYYDSTVYGRRCLQETHITGINRDVKSSIEINSKGNYGDNNLISSGEFQYYSNGNYLGIVLATDINEYKLVNYVSNVPLYAFNVSMEKPDNVVISWTPTFTTNYVINNILIS